MRLAIAILFAFVLSCAAEIIPSSNRVDWVLGQNVGVEGGIPNRTTIWTSFTATATAAHINGALGDCPSNQVALPRSRNLHHQCAAGFRSGRGVTLRGAGMTNTILDLSHNGTAIVMGPSISDSASAGTAINSGYSKGSSNVVVASASGLSVSDLVLIDQLKDTNFMWSTGSINDRNLGQHCVIKAIAGTTITIWPPLHYGLTPRATPLLHHYSGNRIERCGVEDLTVDGTG